MFRTRRINLVFTRIDGEKGEVDPDSLPEELVDDSQHPEPKTPAQAVSQVWFGDGDTLATGYDASEYDEDGVTNTSISGIRRDGTMTVDNVKAQSLGNGGKKR